MADSLGSLVVSLGLDSSTFTDGLTRSEYLVQQSMHNIEGTLGSLKNSITAMAGELGAALSIGAIEEWGRGVVDTAEQMQHLSVITGSSVENLSQLANQARYSGSSFEEFQHLIDKMAIGLGNMGDHTNIAGKALEALGITAKDPAEALKELATKFDQYSDGAGKAAYANDIFGRGIGATVIPLLHNLANGHQEAATLTTADAKAAEEFSKQMRDLAINSTAFKDTLLRDVIPALNRMLENFATAKSSGQGFWASLGFAGSGIDGDYARRIADLNKQIEPLQAHIAQLKSQIASAQPGTSLFASSQKEIASETVDLDKLITSVKTYQQLEANAQYKEYSGYGSHDRGVGQDYTKPPLIHDLTSTAKISAYDQELKSLAQEASKTDLAMQELFSTQKITDAYKAFYTFVGSDAWPKLTTEQQASTELKAHDLDVMQQQENLYKQWATESAKYAADQKKAYDDYMKLGDDALANVTKLTSGLDAEAQSYGGLSQAKDVLLAKTALENAIASGQVADVDAARAAIDKLTASYEHLQVTAATSKAAKEAAAAWKQAANSIENDLITAFDDWVHGAKNLGQQLKDELLKMFDTLVLRPLIAPIAGTIAGLVSPGASASGGVSGALSGVSSINNLFGSGASATQLFTSFAESGVGSALGLSTTVGASAAASAAGGLSLGVEAGATAVAGLSTAGAAIAAAIPVIGWVVGLGMLAYSIFGSKGGGPKTGGFAQTGTDFGRFFTPNQADASLQTVAGGDQSAYNATLAALGGTGSANFAFGYDTDPKGTANSRLSVGATVNGQNVYGFTNRDEGRGDAGIKADLSLEAQRALLAALQASNLPKDIANILDSIVPADSSAAQVQQVIELASAYSDLGKMLKANPIADAMDAFAKSSQGAFGTFSNATDAYKTLLSTYDGSTTATVALDKASQAYYQSLVALLAQIQQVKASIDAMFSSTIRNFQIQSLDKQGQYAFYQQDAQSTLANIRTSTDPAQIQRLETQYNSDLTSAFGLLDPAQRTALLSQFIAAANTGDAAGNTRLTQIGATAAGTFNDNLTAAQTAITAAATSMQTAAATLTAAANTSNTAANTQLVAARTPVHVDVTVNTTTGEVNAGG